MIEQGAELAFIEMERLETEKKAIIAKDRQIENIQREVNELGKLTDLEEDINQANEKALLLSREIQDTIDIEIDKQLLLKQVELNRLDEVEKAKEDAVAADKKRRWEEVNRMVELSSKSLDILSKYSKEAFQLNKAVKIAEAIQNTWVGATEAFRQGGMLGFVTGGLVIAAGMAQVNEIRSQSYPGRAGGGSVQAGHGYMVGEGGRSEMFVPNRSGQIIPNSQLGGQAVNVNFNIDNVDASGFDELLMTRKNLIVSMVRQAVGQGVLA